MLRRLRNLAPNAVGMPVLLATGRCLWSPGVEQKHGKAAPPSERIFKDRPCSVCVMNSSYAGSTSSTAAVDVQRCSPHFWMKDSDRFTFKVVDLPKATAESKISELIKSGKYDVFVNLCDGSTYEDRAGPGVLLALESNAAAYTGSEPWCFETSKPDMKRLLLDSSVVKCPQSATIPTALKEDEVSVAALCRHLKLPVLVKQPAGLASIGMKADSLCQSLGDLMKELKRFPPEGSGPDGLLVEEFISGGEVTVFVTEGPDGKPHVFPPVGIKLDTPDTFLHFDEKWNEKMCVMSRAYRFSNPDQADLVKKLQLAAADVFIKIMGGTGYGRCDFRIDATTGEPYFLEINPNCGLFYPWDATDPNGPHKEWMHGDFADMAILLDPSWSHEDFIKHQIEGALRRQAEKKQWWNATMNTVEAVDDVDAGSVLFGTKKRPVSLELLKLGRRDATSTVQDVAIFRRADGVIGMSYAPIRIYDGTCDVNCELAALPTTHIRTTKPIKSGEELVLRVS